MGKWAYLVCLHKNKILNIDSLILRQKSLLKEIWGFFILELFSRPHSRNVAVRIDTALGIVKVGSCLLSPLLDITLHASFLCC